MYWIGGPAAAVGLAWLLLSIRARLVLSRAKHPSLAGHVRLARRISRLVRHYELGDSRWFTADGAPNSVGEARRAGFERLAAYFERSRPRSAEQLAEVADGVSDAAFVRRYQVPFPFSRRVRESLRPGVLVEASDGARLHDIDGNEWLDLTGAYGVNVLGYDLYKDCLQRAEATAGGLGPVLGPYHPVIVDTVRRLKAISGLDEVSFHMSGTEAVMQAVRMARYHTGRSHVVRFAGAYHGWWGEVQPGVGNPAPVGSVYTLAEDREASLRVLRTRRDIACVLVNPLQALHPNTNAPGDGALVAARTGAGVDLDAYARWLERLRATCNERGIVLIFDEVFVGFRLARGGAQERFGVRADLVTYGKTLGGGLPVGVLCGRASLMRRFRPERPLDICFARGTFNAHPWVLAAMNAFLQKLDTPEVKAVYDGLEDKWNARAERLNTALAEAGLPVQAANLSSIFTLRYSQPSRYHWMYQFYLNAEGLLLPWVGTGRLIFSINFTDADFDEVIERMVRAGERMAADGWWWYDPDATAGTIRRQLLREMIQAHVQRVSAPASSAVTIGS